MDAEVNAIGGEYTWSDRDSFGNSPTGFEIPDEADGSRPAFEDPSSPEYEDSEELCFNRKVRRLSFQSEQTKRRKR